MSENVEVSSIGAVCDLLSGFAFKSNLFSEDPNDTFLVKGSNVGHRSIDYDAGPWWKNDDLKKLKRYELQENDVILAMDRPIVGDRLKFTWIKKGDKPSLLVQRVARLRGSEKLDIKYLRYVIGSHEFQAYIDTITTGANVPHISGPDIKKYRFPLPNLDIQKKIAGILSAYDDLIENNLKRIKLLEEMAQITYEEWFVRLRFPGHEATPTNPKIGLPEGWKEVELANYFPIRTGKKDANIQTPDGPYPFFTCSQGIYRADDYSFDDEAIILAGNGEFNIKYYRGKFEAYQRNYVLIPYDKKFLFLIFLHMKHYLGRITAGSKGAVIKYLTKDMIGKAKMKQPEAAVLDKFNEIVLPTFHQIENLEKQNERLREARDILLPRLMTGMIDVEDYDPSQLLQEAA